MKTLKTLSSALVLSFIVTSAAQNSGRQAGGGEIIVCHIVD